TLTTQLHTPSLHDALPISSRRVLLARCPATLPCSGQSWMIGALMPEHEVKSLRRVYEALSRWDVDDFVNAVTHDFELISPDTLPWGGTRHGHGGLRTFAAIFQDHV